MKLRKALQNFAKVIAEEAERNPQFEHRIREALGLPEDVGAGRRSKRGTRAAQAERTRGRHRRPPAVLDPIQLAHEGEQVLRDQLLPLTLEQLKDIVADYGMDPGKLVMKWKLPDKIIDRIVEISIGRAQKGDAFR